MNIEDLIQDIRDQLDEPPSDYLTQDTILTWLNTAQLIIAKKAKCVKDSTTITTVADQAEYEIADMLGVDAAIFYDSDTSTHPLKGISWAKAQEKGLVGETGTPYYYVDWPAGSTRNLHLLPAPSADDYEVVVHYYRKAQALVCAEDADGYPEDDAINVDPEVPDEYMDTLVTWCKHKLLRKQEDPDYRNVRADFYEEIEMMIEGEAMKHTDHDNEFDASFYGGAY